VYPPIVGRHSSGPAPDPEDEARLLFRVEVELPDRETKRNLLGILPGMAVTGVAAWAIDRYAQTGAWRRVFVMPLTLFAAAMPFLLTSRTDTVELLSALSAYVVGVFVLTIRIGILGGHR
jgi:hypothetical protein